MAIYGYTDIYGHIRTYKLAGESAQALRGQTIVKKVIFRRFELAGESAEALRGQTIFKKMIFGLTRLI